MFCRTSRAAVAALATVVFALAANVRASVAINLLPLGDSITAQGYYISPLQTLLTNGGYTPTVLANEGHSGYIIDGSIPGATRAGLRENIGVGKNPDFLNHAGVNQSNTYILLMIGTNDVDLGFDLATSQVQSRMSGLIGAIRTEAPLAHLIVAKIVPNLGSGKDPAVQQFNTDIAGVSTGPNVSLVDMYSAFKNYPGYSSNPSLLMGDNLHPNQQGGNVMANVWYAGITAAPEPASTSLAAVGLASVLGARRRRVV